MLINTFDVPDGREEDGSGRDAATAGLHAAPNLVVEHLKLEAAALEPRRGVAWIYHALTYCDPTGRPLPFPHLVEECGAYEAVGLERRNKVIGQHILLVDGSDGQFTN